MYVCMYTYIKIDHPFNIWIILNSAYIYFILCMYVCMYVNAVYAMCVYLNIFILF